MTTLRHEIIKSMPYEILSFLIKRKELHKATNMAIDCYISFATTTNTSIITCKKPALYLVQLRFFAIKSINPLFDMRLDINIYKYWDNLLKEYIQYEEDLRKKKLTHRIRHKLPDCNMCA